jgi:hypothetical protein
VSTIFDHLPSLMCIYFSDTTSPSATSAASSPSSTSKSGASNLNVDGLIGTGAALVGALAVLV